MELKDDSNNIVVRVSSGAFEIKKWISCTNRQNEALADIREVPPTHYAHLGMWRQSIRGVEIHEVKGLGIWIFRCKAVFDETQQQIQLRVPLDQEANHKVLVIAGFHAREWLAQDLVLGMQRVLASAKYEAGSKEKKDVTEFLLISCVNPVGFASTCVPYLETEFLSVIKDGNLEECKDRFDAMALRHTRKQCRDRGVDINRNFPFFWEYNQSKNDPLHETYPGSEASQHPICTFLMEYTKTQNPDFVIDLHDYGNYVIPYPCWLEGDTPEISAEIKGKIEEAQRLLKPAYTLLSECLFEKEAIKTPGYSAYGIYVHYCIANLGIPAVAIEVGGPQDRFYADTPTNMREERRLIKQLFCYVYKLWNLKPPNIKDTMFYRASAPILF